MADEQKHIIIPTSAELRDGSRQLIAQQAARIVQLERLLTAERKACAKIAYDAADRHLTNSISRLENDDTIGAEIENGAAEAIREIAATIAAAKEGER